MCSGNRSWWSEKMAIINFAYVCFTVALLFSVNCAAQTTVQPNTDQEVITTVIGTTVVIETANTGEILTTEKTAAVPSSAKAGNGTGNSNEPTASAPASVSATVAPAISPSVKLPGENDTITNAPTGVTQIATTPIVPTAAENANCTENCTATTPVPAPVAASSSAPGTVKPTSGAGTETMTTEALPDGTTANRGTSEQAPVVTSKPSVNTDSPVATSPVAKVTTGAVQMTTKGALPTEPMEPTTKAATVKPTPKAETVKPTQKAKPTSKTPQKQTTSASKQTTTDEGNVVPAKTSGGHKTATIVAVTIFAIALVALLAVGYFYRQRKLRNNYGRLNEENEEGGWSAFSKNPIYRGDRDYQPL